MRIALSFKESGRFRFPNVPDLEPMPVAVAMAKEGIFEYDSNYRLPVGSGAFGSSVSKRPEPNREG